MAVGRWVGFGLKKTIQGVDTVAGAVGTARRWRSGESGRSSQERVRDATMPGEDVPTAAIQERGEPDVQAESPEPGEMIVDQDVVEDVVDDVDEGAGGRGADSDEGSSGTRDDAAGE